MILQCVEESFKLSFTASIEGISSLEIFVVECSVVTILFSHDNSLSLSLSDNILFILCLYFT